MTCVRILVANLWQRGILITVYTVEQAISSTPRSRKTTDDMLDLLVDVPSFTTSITAQYLTVLHSATFLKYLPLSMTQFQYTIAVLIYSGLTAY